MGASVRAWVRQHQLVMYFILAYLLTWALAGLRHTAPPVPEVWHALGALGPITAAFAVTAMALGRRGARQLLASMGRWRVGLRWLFVAVLSPFALFAIAAGVAHIAGQPWPDLGLLAARFGAASWLLGAFLAAVVYAIPAPGRTAAREATTSAASWRLRQAEVSGLDPRPRPRRGEA